MDESASMLALHAYSHGDGVLPACCCPRIVRLLTFSLGASRPCRLQHNGEKRIATLYKKKYEREKGTSSFPKYVGYKMPANCLIFHIKSLSVYPKMNPPLSHFSGFSSSHVTSFYPQSFAYRCVIHTFFKKGV
jgi:hypothetical protein